MKRRNPQRSRGLPRVRSLSPTDPRTPGQMLFDYVMSSPVIGEPKVRLIERASRLLAAEARAGLWSGR